MTCAYFVDARTAAGSGPALADQYRSEIVPALMARSEVQSVHLYHPMSLPVRSTRTKMPRN